MLQKLGAARDTEDHVRALEARRATLSRGEQGIRDVAEQAPPGGVVGQGAVPSRGEYRCERAHSEQQQPDGEEDQGVGEAIRGHLSVLHGAVQVHGGRGGERVSIRSSRPLFASRETRESGNEWIRIRRKVVARDDAGNRLSIRCVIAIRSSGEHVEKF